MAGLAVDIAEDVDHEVGVGPAGARSPGRLTNDRPRRIPSPQALKAAVMLADAAALALGIALAFLIQRAARPVPSWVIVDHLMLAIAALPGFVAGALWNRLYLARANERPGEEARHVLRAVATGMGTLLALSFVVQYPHLSRLWVVSMAVCVAATVLAERRLVRRWFARMRRERALRRRILVVGTDAHAIGLMHAFQRNPALGYEVVGMVGDDDLGIREGVGVVGPVDAIEELLVATSSVGVVVSQSGVSPADVNLLTRRLTDSGFHVTLSSSLHDIAIERLRAHEVDGHTMLYVEATVRGGWRALAKRAYDVAFAASLLLVAMPLVAVAAAAIKLTSRGPVFFRQERVGRDAAPFRLFKLRTMVADAEARKHDLMALNEADGPIFKIRHDPRVTPVGRVLRKFSIDELPQLWNVIRGDMSMVGPRPMLPTETAQLDPTVLSERVRVLPGLTGLWQVSGRSSASFEQYARFDRYYVDNWSLAVDLKICVRTVGVVLNGRGAA